jgi:predicted small lipoprotein YifL
VILIVKSYLYLSRIAVFSATFALAGLLAACGQRGPLYLPSKPDAAKTPVKPIPVPSPIPTDSTAPASK